jgi:hypothetical protein
MQSKGQNWTKKEKKANKEKERLRKQRAAAASAPKGADPAAGARNPGLCTFTF